MDSLNVSAKHQPRLRDGSVHCGSRRRRLHCCRRAVGYDGLGRQQLINRLETRLGTKLLHRTTRKLQLTPEGSAFHERCLRILDDIDCAEHEAAQVGSPRGRVRINSHVPSASITCCRACRSFWNASRTCNWM